MECHFDAITSRVATVSTRRDALRLLASAALGVGGLRLLGVESGQAKKKGGKKKGGKGQHGSSPPSVPTTPSAPSVPQDQCPVAARTNAPVCGNDPDGVCDCHQAVEGHNFCGGFLTSCAGLHACTSTQDCRDAVGFHFVCQAANGEGCGQVCVPECENRYPY